ncbi:hypothetical protein CA236_05140 [Sphingomonas sp. ABOLG]|uniref:hypothetical protein n=1 Tax=Sphingomonas sp. ABOLG TaxID=1985880 RepID=UPI000F7E5A8F|nr:hypothetical protein [Sphingomonas sp. ABOLG]RSV19410.1 hypothetical protein CA236_05140 [Sphingomonas sp. ABOLG]
MPSPLRIPAGTVFAHDGVRISFVEEVDDFVLRFVVEGTEDEFFVEAAPGVRVRPTVQWLLDEFAAGRLREFTASEATLTEWRGRYLGWDRTACLAKQPRAVRKYELALAALVQGKPRSATVLEDFAKEMYPDDEIASGRSIIRWMNNLEAFGEKVGVMMNRSGREKGRSPLPPIVDRLVHQAMALHWSVDAIKKMDAYALTVAAWHRLKEAGATGLGDAPPHKSTVVNRINKCEDMEAWTSKHGPHEANRYFLASGESMPITRPFQLAYIDGTEFEQVCLFSADAEIPSNKMKIVQVMDACALFAYPTTPFSGPYRSEMGMYALMGALTPPVLTEEDMAADPMRVLFFGRQGLLRGDNDKAIIPPSAIGNLASVIGRVELAKRYGSDEKSSVENYFGWLKRRLEGEPGTVLSARSRRRSIRRDPMKEAAMTRASFAQKLEALRLEWNDTGHEAIGWRKPNDVMLEFISAQRTRFSDPKDVRRNLARTVRGVLTTDGVVHDNITYRWNREGVTQTLSSNLAAQAFSKRLEGTAKCDVWLRVFDWNLDVIEIMDEAGNDFVELWSDDPDYTLFLTRFEHRFHQSCMIEGSTGAQTAEQRALRRAESLQQQWEDLHNLPYAIAKKAGAVLERAEVRAKARNVADDPDLTDFSAFMIPTDLGGTQRADVPLGPTQSRSADGPDEATDTRADMNRGPAGDWGGLDPAPRSNLDMLVADQEQEDLDGGIDWDADDDRRSEDSSTGDDA